jgi:hypothetical protein
MGFFTIMGCRQLFESQTLLSLPHLWQEYKFAALNWQIQSR